MIACLLLQAAMVALFFMRFWAARFLELDMDKVWGRGAHPTSAPDELHKVKTGLYDGKIIAWMELDIPDPAEGKKGGRGRALRYKNTDFTEGKHGGPAHKKLMIEFRKMPSGVLTKSDSVAGPEHVIQASDEYVFLNTSAIEAASWKMAFEIAQSSDLYTPDEDDVVVICSYPFGVLKDSPSNDSNDVGLSQEELSAVFGHAYTYTPASTPFVVNAPLADFPMLMTVSAWNKWECLDSPMTFPGKAHKHLGYDTGGWGANVSCWYVFYKKNVAPTLRQRSAKTIRDVLGENKCDLFDFTRLTATAHVMSSLQVQLLTERWSVTLWVVGAHQGTCIRYDPKKRKGGSRSRQ